MPEEINRILSDHCSDYLFAPTENSKKILLAEGISEEKIYVTGNTIVDAVLQNVKLAEKKSKLLEKLDLKKQKYFLATAHRQENVDDKNRFQNILTALQKLNQQYNLPIIYPIHPRAYKKIKEFQLTTTGITLINPTDFLSFLQLEKNAKIVLTDSGGVQEETCILGIPCVTLRDNTERPETIKVGSNIIAGTTPDKIINCVSKMYAKSKTWNNPFGDGKTGEKIIKILKEVE
jgi:UDP-N-acetylglucosamine 2-epimerase (non-hydrolysing)